MYLQQTEEVLDIPWRIVTGLVALKIFSSLQPSNQLHANFSIPRNITLVKSQERKRTFF